MFQLPLEIDFGFTDPNVFGPGDWIELQSIYAMGLTASWLFNHGFVRKVSPFVGADPSEQYLLIQLDKPLVCHNV